MENHVRTVPSCKKTDTIQVPNNTSPFRSQSATPMQLSSGNCGESPLISSSPDNLPVSSSTTPLSPLDSPFNTLIKLGEFLSQPRLIQARQCETQKLEAKFTQMEEILGDSRFDSIGEFLEVLVYNY